MPKKSASCSICAFIVLACFAPGALAQAVDTAATKAAVMAADKALADRVAREGAAAYLAELDDDAAVLFPGQPILEGEKQSRAAFIARYGAPSSYTWNPVHAVASADGKLACTMGYSHFTSAADSTHASRTGIYLTCWRKNDGKWKIVGVQRTDSPPRPPSTADRTDLPAGPHSSASSSGKNQLRAAQEADSLFAAMGALPAGPGPAFARYAADDAFLLGGDVFPRGPQQIEEAFQGFPATRILSWMPMWKFGYGTGGLAFTVGHAINGPRAGNSGPTNYQKYFTVWRQEPDGRWLYIFDLGTSRPAP